MPDNQQLLDIEAIKALKESEEAYERKAHTLEVDNEAARIGLRLGDERRRQLVEARKAIDRNTRAMAALRAEEQRRADDQATRAEENAALADSRADEAASSAELAEAAAGEAEDEERSAGGEKSSRWDHEVTLFSAPTGPAPVAARAIARLLPEDRKSTR